MRTIHAILLGTSVAAALVGACEGPIDPRSTDDPAVGPGELVEVTVVTMNGAGAPTVETHRITRAEQERMKEVRRLRQSGVAAAVVGSDGICKDTSMWLYDQPNLGGRMLCLQRFDTADHTEGPEADLWYYMRTGYSYWARNVRSFWAGEDAGYFRLQLQPYTTDTFWAWERRDSVSATVSSADVMSLHRQYDRENVFFRSIQVIQAGTACPTKYLYVIRADGKYDDARFSQVWGSRRPHPSQPDMAECYYGKYIDLERGAPYEVMFNAVTCRDLSLVDRSLIMDGKYYAGSSTVAMGHNFGACHGE